MRVKHLDAMSSGRSSNGAVGSLDAVVEPVEAEGGHIDAGGGRTKDKHEAEEILDVPALRDLEVFGVHVVPWDGDLGNVVEEVLDEDLKTGHRVEWEPAACDEDREDIAKVAACYHFDVFDTAWNVSSPWWEKGEEEKTRARTCYHV